MAIKTKLFKDINSLILQVETWSKEGKRIIFTNGCFDLVHAGHVTYLEEAKSLGDILIVGVNSDASISKLKGSNRPIIPQSERLIVLAALESVDAVILFDQDTPLALIEAISPDILVKGGDWQINQIVGADHVIAKGGTVKSLQFIEGLSTTNIEHKIKSS